MRDTVRNEDIGTRMGIKKNTVTPVEEKKAKVVLILRRNTDTG